MQNDANKIFFEKIRKLRNEADRVLFSDGGKHWPIFRIKDELYADFWSFFEKYLKFAYRSGEVSNKKRGKLKLPAYHPMHKNPFYYDDAVQEIYDANGVLKKDKVDIVRRGIEAFIHFLHSKSSEKLQTLRKKTGGTTNG